MKIKVLSLENHEANIILSGRIFDVEEIYHNNSIKTTNALYFCEGEYQFMEDNHDDSK